jgi:hypothetical protein
MKNIIIAGWLGGRLLWSKTRRGSRGGQQHSILLDRQPPMLGMVARIVGEIR